MLEWENGPYTHTYTHTHRHTHTHIYTHTHTHTHTKEVKTEQLATQERLSFGHLLSKLFAKMSYVPGRFNGNADLLTFTKLASLARGHP